jgi:nicotinamidase-related amidase
MIIKDSFETNASLVEKYKAVTVLPDDKPILLIIDLDHCYSQGEDSFDSDYIAEIQQFIEQNRDHFNVVHIWHAHKRILNIYPDETALMTSSIEKVTGVQDNRYDHYFPISAPQVGEWVLGKPEYSAFDDTNLASCLPNNSTIFVLGAFGDRCIQKTMKDGIREGHNMIALEDLVYKHNRDPRSQMEHNTKVLEYNSQVMTALLP